MKRLVADCLKKVREERPLFPQVSGVLHRSWGVYRESLAHTESAHTEILVNRKCSLCPVSVFIHNAALGTLSFGWLAVCVKSRNTACSLCWADTRAAFQPLMYLERSQTHPHTLTVKFIPGYPFCFRVGLREMRGHCSFPSPQLWTRKQNPLADVNSWSNFLYFYKGGFTFSCHCGDGEGTFLHPLIMSN